MRNPALLNNRFLSRTNPDYIRAVADSGSVLNSGEINTLMKQMVDLGIADKLIFWQHLGLLKTRTSGSDLFVPKAYDISGQNNDATQATTSKQPKILSTAIYFDGSDDELNYGNASILRTSNNITACFWVKVYSDSSTGRPIFGRWRYDTGVNKRVWCFWLAASGAMAVFASNDGSLANRKNYTGTSSIRDNTYRHFAFTFATNSLEIYENKDVYSYTKVEDVTVNSLADLDASLMMGRAENNTPYIKVDINDARIFNSVLTSTQIAAIYNATKSKYGH